MKIGIYGYGNLGRGVECAVTSAPDMELVGVFTRRAPESVKTLTGAKVYHVSEALNFRSEIDVMIICGGSATDLPEMTPELARHFNVVDSFDTHAKIPEHLKRVDDSAREGGNLALISGGWDPGLFSIARVYASAFLPSGKDYTFWGKGISQGHSDAIRRLPGVVDARQYTIPIEEAISAVRAGESPELTTAEKHRRLCYVVAEEGADKAEIEKKIKTMPNYFSDYDTTVEFISREELISEHGGMPHGGAVIRNGRTGLSGESSHTVELNIRLDSNPEFTGSVLVAAARAVGRMRARGVTGSITMLDVAPADLSELDRLTLISKML